MVCIDNRRKSTVFLSVGFAPSSPRLRNRVGSPGVRVGVGALNTIIHSCRRRSPPLPNRKFQLAIQLRERGVPETRSGEVFTQAPAVQDLGYDVKTGGPRVGRIDARVNIGEEVVENVWVDVREPDGADCASGENARMLAQERGGDVEGLLAGEAVPSDFRGQHLGRRTDDDFNVCW